jgi:exopolysaccharide production protein ExoZ
LIQALRAVAATAVLLFHAAASTRDRLPSASLLYAIVDDRFTLGVPLFFAISGFVLTHAIQRESVPRFLVARFLRIYPAFFLAVALTLLLSMVPSGTIPWPPGSWLALTLLPLGPTPRPLGGIEWTLVYEVSFYLVFPLLWIARSRRAAWLFCAGWLAAILVASVEWPGRYTHEMPRGVSILLSAFNLPFIFGILAYLIHERLSLPRSRMLLIPVVALLIGLHFVQTRDTEYLIAGLAFGLLLTSVGRQCLDRDIARHSLLARCGDYSYGLYLLHYTIVVAIASRIVPTRWSPATLFAFLVCAGFVGGCLFGAFERGPYGRMKRLVLERVPPASSP